MDSGERVKVKDCVAEFMKGAAEMTVELGKGCRDIVKQSLMNQDSYINRNFGKDSYVGKRVRGPCHMLCNKLSFFNEYLPEDKDPLHAWSVIFFVSLLAFAGMNFWNNSPHCSGGFTINFMLKLSFTSLDIRNSSM